MHYLDELDSASLRSDVPDFRPGDTVKVHVRVVEGGKERLQVFQGIVIRRSGGGLQETFTVRKISFGVGVERTFPLHSPSVAKLELVTHGKVRRAKLYYLRDLTGKKSRIRERRLSPEELAAEAAALEAMEASDAEAIEASDGEAAPSGEEAAVEATDAETPVEEPAAEAAE